MPASHLRIDAYYSRWWRRLVHLAKTLMHHEPHRALKYSMRAADGMCDLIRSRHVDSPEMYRDFQSLCLEAFELEDAARAVLVPLESAPLTTSLPAPAAPGFFPFAIPDSAPPAASQPTLLAASEPTTVPPELAPAATSEPAPPAIPEPALLAASEPATATPKLAPAATFEPAPPAILELAPLTASEAAIATPELAPLATFESAPSASAEPAPLGATAIVTLSLAVSSAPAAISPYAPAFVRGERAPSHHAPGLVPHHSL